MKKRVHAELGDFNYGFSEHDEGFSTGNISKTPKRSTLMRMNDDSNKKCKMLPNKIIDMLVTVAVRQVLQILFCSEKESAREVKYKIRLITIKNISKSHELLSWR